MISAVSHPERVTHHFHRVICDWIIQAAVEFSVPTLTALAAIDYVNRCLAVKKVDKCMLSLMANYALYLVADGEITKMEFVSVFEGTSFATRENHNTAEMLMDSIEPLALHPATVAHMFVNTDVCEIELYKPREQPSCAQPMFSRPLCTQEQFVELMEQLKKPSTEDGDLPQNAKIAVSNFMTSTADDRSFLKELMAHALLDNVERILCVAASEYTLLKYRHSLVGLACVYIVLNQCPSVPTYIKRHALLVDGVAISFRELNECYLDLQKILLLWMIREPERSSSPTAIDQFVSIEDDTKKRSRESQTVQPRKVRKCLDDAFERNKTTTFTIMNGEIVSQVTDAKRETVFTIGKVTTELHF